MPSVRNLILLLTFLVGTAGWSADSPPQAGTEPSPKLILISWDGAADHVVDRLLTEGRLPNLHRMAREGAAAEHSRSSFPSKTAPGHASLWTGCWASCNGITTNNALGEPPSDNLLAAYDGFSAEMLRAEPIFVSAARAGKKVVVLSATQTHPVDEHLAAVNDPERLVLFSGFRSEIEQGTFYGPESFRPADPSWIEAREHPEARELELSVGETTLYALAYDADDDPTEGLDTLLVRRGSRLAADDPGLFLRPLEAGADPMTTLTAWSPPLGVVCGARTGNTFLRLFELSPDGSRFGLYQRAVHDLDAAAPDGAKQAYLQAYPAFHDEVFWRYAQGLFGPSRMAGGDGTAERRLLELTAFDTELLIRGTRWVITSWKPDFLMHYSPIVDGASHTWFGIFDPESSSYDAELEKQLWPVLVAVYQQVDRWLGAILDLAPPETIVAVASDHGMAGAGRRFFANRVLEQAGLLNRTVDDEVDLSRTRILMPPAASFYLQVNDTRWRGGIVSVEERAGVLADATRALLAARDPDTGKRIVERVLTIDDLAEVGAGGERDGDLYLDLFPDYYPSRSLSNRIAARDRRSWGGGWHGAWPFERKMHAIFYVRGPGVPVGVTGPAIRHIDIAPTLSRLLGISPPRDATGRVIEEFLSAPR